MKKTIRFWFLMLLCLSYLTVGAVEADEYAYKKIACRNGKTLRTETPVTTASSMSQVEILYEASDIRLCEGDLITGISFQGYNPGKELTRHFTVWMMNEKNLTYRPPQQFTSTDEMTKVFEGDCTILHGGTAERLEEILSIAFDTPLAYKSPYKIRMTIISQGETSADSIYFLQDQPFTTFTVATPVRYVSGTVTDEDGKGVTGATIRLRSLQWDETNYEGITDAEGKYLIRIEEGNKTYMPSVSAPGHTSYSEVCDFAVQGNPVKNYTLYGSVTYPANEQSTIILPVAPDASVGKYYKLVRREGKKFIFVLEPSPQANIPYVLFADRDYRIDLTGMDLSIAPGRTVIDSLSLVGSYSNGIYAFADYIDRDLDAHSKTGQAMHAHLYGHYSLLLNDDFELVFLDSDAQLMQKEGKRWRYYYTNGFYEMNFNYYIKGDSVIDGERYSKMYAAMVNQWTGEARKDSYAGALLEKEGRVYIHNSQYGKQLLCDFNLKKGDVVDCGGRWTVTDVRNIYVMGFTRKCLTLELNDNHTEKQYWVEGVGSSRGMDPLATLPLVTCYEDGHCIFTEKNFEGMPENYVNVRNRRRIEEDQEWWYKDYYAFEDGRNEDFRMFIKGDTITDLGWWMKVYRDNTVGSVPVYVKAICDYGDAVYELSQDGVESLLFDYTLNIGDRYTPTGRDDRYLEVIAKDIVISAGIPHRRLILQQYVNGVETDLTCWIEGIGSECGIDLPALWSDMDPKVINAQGGMDYYHYHFTGCQKKDGTCFYGETPGVKTTATAVRKPTTSSPYYDLQGRKVTQPKRGVYILGGRKVVVK